MKKLTNTPLTRTAWAAAAGQTLEPVHHPKRRHPNSSGDLDGLNQHPEDSQVALAEPFRQPADQTSLNEGVRNPHRHQHPSDLKGADAKRAQEGDRGDTVKPGCHKAKDHLNQQQHLQLWAALQMGDRGERVDF